MYFFLLNIRSLFIGYQWVFLSIEIISLISDITMKGFTGSEYSHWFSLNFCLCCSNLSEFEINLNNSSIAGWQRRLVQAGLLGWMRHSNWHIHHQLQTSSLRYPQSTVRSCTPGPRQESRMINQDTRGLDSRSNDKTTDPGLHVCCLSRMRWTFSILTRHICTIKVCFCFWSSVQVWNSTATRNQRIPKNFYWYPTKPNKVRGDEKSCRYKLPLWFYYSHSFLVLFQFNKRK